MCAARDLTRAAAKKAAGDVSFALVRCAKTRVSIADIEPHLDRRTLKVHGRAGDAKPYWQAAAQA